MYGNGSTYEGAWRNGKRNGYGIYQDAQTRNVYEGKWINDVRCGKGKYLQA